MARILPIALICLFAFPLSLFADGPTPAERGRKALIETAFIPAFWRARALDNAWKEWDGMRAKPTNYDSAFRERYGLHEAPYPNAGQPMGLRKAPLVFGEGIGIDCMVCHGSSLMGKSYIGLGNSSLDVHALFEELGRANGVKSPPPFAFSNVRGTSEAGGFAVYLLGFRNPDLSLRLPPKELGLHDDLCEDVPAWWLLKKKRTMYHTGATDSRSVRSLMQFMMHPLTTPDDFRKHEAAFKDILEYFLTLEAPKYPLAIDKTKAAAGQLLFQENCTRCHGTYGEKWTYPNKIIPLSEIGTDPNRHRGIELTYGAEYSNSWFGKEPGGWFINGKALNPTAGYQAPPLDGIWATAPYFHNGSVPTLEGVLNSKARPGLFTRSFRTGVEDYDPDGVGWRVQTLTERAPSTVAPIERRKIYDTTQPGRSNKGHTYGDSLTAEQRAEVIEYLKTL